MAETRDSFVREQHYSVHDTEPVDRGPHVLSSSRSTDLLVLIQGQALKCSQSIKVKHFHGKLLEADIISSSVLLATGLVSVS